MPYQLNWFIPKRIVMLEYRGELTETEIYASDVDLCRYYDEGDSTAAHIHQICIFDASSKNNSLAVLMSLKWPKHPRNGWMVGVGQANTLERILGGFAAQLFKIHFRSFDTLEHAVDFLYSVDPTLPKFSRPSATTRGDHHP